MFGLNINSLSAFSNRNGVKVIKLLVYDISYFLSLFLLSSLFFIWNLISTHPRLFAFTPLFYFPRLSLVLTLFQLLPCSYFACTFHSNLSNPEQAVEYNYGMSATKLLAACSSCPAWCTPGRWSMTAMVILMAGGSMSSG